MVFENFFLLEDRMKKVLVMIGVYVIMLVFMWCYWLEGCLFGVWKVNRVLNFNFRLCKVMINFVYGYVN